MACIDKVRPRDPPWMTTSWKEDQKTTHRQKKMEDDTNGEEDLLISSTYQAEYMPKTTALGEVLMNFASTSSPRLKKATASPRNFAFNGDSVPWYVHMIACTGLLLMWWFGMLHIYANIRFQPWWTAFILFTCSALVYFCCSWLLMCIPLTTEFGYKLWWRHFCHTSSNDALRSVLEICTWIALIVGTFASTHNFILSIVVGGVSGICVGLIGDFIFVYIRVHNESLQEEIQPLGLKYTVTTACLGYILLGFVRLVYGFLSDDTQHQSMASQYLLSILLGVSLVVTSELLLLYGPTRHAGVILQARVVHAKENWKFHPLRSFIELSFVFMVTIVLNDVFNDMVLSLQGGTLICTIFILCGELFFYPSSSGTNRDIPHDHWIKVLPIISVGAFTLFHVFSTVYRHAHILLPAIDILGLALVAKIFRLKLVWNRIWSIRENTRLHSFRTSLEILAHCTFVYSIQTMPFPTWTKIFLCLCFDISLISIQKMGYALWNAIYEVQYATTYLVEVELKHKIAQTSSNKVGIHPTRRLIWDLDEHEPPFSVPATECYVVPLYIIFNFAIALSFPLVGLWYGCSLLARIGGVFVWLILSCFLGACVGLLIALVSCSNHVKFRLLRRLLVFSLHQQCQFYPLQVLVHIGVCFGVFAGTYAISGAWIYSLILSICSMVGVLSGGRYVLGRLSSPANDHLHATCAVVFFIALFSYGVGLCLFFIYFYIHRIEIAFCLATLSGVVFIASSELLILWEPTRIAGYILQTRVTHSIENWKTEPLRSFLELLVWISVTYGTFALYQDVIVALHLGTFSGIVVALAGEVFRNRWRFHHQNIDVKQRPKVLPLLLLFAYIGAGTFQWIFEHLRSLEVTVLLATVAGIIFLCVADVLAMWQPTRWAGVILQDRFLNASEHWQLFPVRSFVEVGCFLGVIYGSHAIYGDLTVAVQCGTLSGMLVTLIGEQLKSHRKVRTEEKQNQILPFPIISVLGFVGCVAFNTIYTQLKNMEMAFVLATASGVVFVVLGDMFVFWAPTRYVGIILQTRILHFSRDLRHSWRCYVELSACMLVLYVSYCYLWQGDLLVAIQACTFTGIMICVVGELILESIQKYEKKMVQQGRWHAQDQSDLLSMPYEVLFETARFLTPEELLVTRTTCHKVNNLLRAESKRFWLHATLRRQFGLTRRARVNDHHRSLIYEAWKAIMPKIFAPREPETILTAKLAHNRALKWVFVNAEWIRLQNMPRKQSNVEFIRLEPTDVGFDVFRHFPDKDLLGIQVEQSHPLLETTLLSVPSQVYGKIQADPFSFVVSETLYEVEIFSHWHVCSVLFVAMVVVSLAHAASEIASSFG